MEIDFLTFTFKHKKYFPWVKWFFTELIRLEIPSYHMKNGEVFQS